MSNVLLNVKGLSKNFDGVKALDDFSCQVNSAEIIGLIGPNGAGKTTFFNVLCGYVTPEKGAISFKGEQILSWSPERIGMLGIARTFQILRLFRKLTVLENVLLAFRGNPGENLWNLFFHPRLCMHYEDSARKYAITLLKEFNLGEKVHDHASDLSYGQQKLLSIACCIATDADLLLLDEPIAGVAPEILERIVKLIQVIRNNGKSILLIEHNIDAVMSICDRVLFMDEGHVISEGSPDYVRADHAVLQSYLGEL